MWNWHGELLFFTRMYFSCVEPDVKFSFFLIVKTSITKTNTWKNEPLKKREMSLCSKHLQFIFFLWLNLKQVLINKHLGKWAFQWECSSSKKKHFNRLYPPTNKNKKFISGIFFFLHIWNKVNIFIFSLWLKSKGVVQQETVLKMSHIVIVFLFKKEHFTQLYTRTRKKHRKISPFFFRRLFSYLEWGENVLIKTSVT